MRVEGDDDVGIGVVCGMPEQAPRDIRIGVRDDGHGACGPTDLVAQPRTGCDDSYPFHASRWPRGPA